MGGVLVVEAKVYFIYFMWILIMCAFIRIHIFSPFVMSSFIQGSLFLEASFIFSMLLLLLLYHFYTIFYDCTYHSKILHLWGFSLYLLSLFIFIWNILFYLKNLVHFFISSDMLHFIRLLLHFFLLLLGSYHIFSLKLFCFSFLIFHFDILTRFIIYWYFPLYFSVFFVSLISIWLLKYIWFIQQKLSTICIPSHDI